MKTTFLFERKNYVIMIIGIALIFLCLSLMTGGGSEDPNVYSPELFSARRIIVAPFLIVLGLSLEICAIMHQPNTK